jgi:molybdopterin molybdotransferase
MGALPVLGFPGNPVSTAVCALIFLRLALQRLLGLPGGLRHDAAPLVGEWPENDQRQDYLRGFWVEGERGRVVRTAPRQDSSMLATLAAADVLVVRPPFDAARQSGHIATVIDLPQALASLR